jgi:hypothetical protein
MEVIAMGLMDKVKAQASQAQAAAKEAAQKGQAKIDQVQAKRAADGMLRDLGVAFYAQHTDRGTANTQSDIDRLIEALQSHEQTNGPIDLTVS